MTDPAVEAAQRAWDAEDSLDGIPYRAGEVGLWSPVAMEAAASQALAPIHDRHRPFTRDYPGGDGRTVCAYCLGPKDWPCPDALDAYTSAELERVRAAATPPRGEGWVVLRQNTFGAWYVLSKGVHPSEQLARLEVRDLAREVVVLWQGTQAATLNYRSTHGIEPTGRLP